MRTTRLPLLPMGGYADEGMPGGGGYGTGPETNRGLILLNVAKCTSWMHAGEGGCGGRI